ncbi:alpha/beta hydrolase [Chelativorans sp. AA-79]|uniref:alpha/beta fold hydrolase n=1 Tax=Chelativorans sp. AA-79 TaxID=3028735 RepID=UPI0023F71AD8|nr:alpha/beta hydrolase [Chelativorans sp. AA-79]WEX08004.1 alpha/beta hydrolase [Chelativorans sp. AA-79]
MPTVALNGATFVYDEAGSADAEPIIALHGGRGIGDRHGEFNAWSALSDTYRLIAYDQRGCGQTSLTPPYTFEQLADDVEAFRQTLCGGRRIILQGGSFGGMIALTYAVKYPQGLSRLILRGTAPSHHNEDDAFETFRARLHKASSASEGMLRKMFSDTVVDDTELRLIWLALQPLYFEKFDPDAALERTRTMHLHAETHNALFKERSYDLRDRLPEIQVPTLVIVGAEDWICTPNHSRLIADQVPNAELFEVPGANHAVHVEANDIVISAARDFLARSAG